MMSVRELFLFVCLLCSGLMAGFFYAFSVCVMQALGKLPPAQGIAAMQSINVVVMNPRFLTIFAGTALASAGAMAWALLRWRLPGSAWMLAGGALYLFGTFFVTMRFNVPRNDALAALAPGSAEGATFWKSYLSSWTAWNHVRMAAAFAATAAFAIASWRE